MDILLIALLGLATGGVVNALADDLPAGRGPRLPRYHDGSRRPVAAWLGVTAFLFGLRRIRSGAPGALKTAREEPRILSWRYPLTEIALSVLMALTFETARSRLSLPVGKLLIWQVLVALFVLVAIVDIERRRILRAPLLLIVALAIFGELAFTQSPSAVVSMLAGALSAGLMFSLVYFGGAALKTLAPARWRPPANVVVFGRGDVQLMTVGGLIVGFPAALWAMALTILLGGVGALIYVAIKSVIGNGYQPFSAIPYGPFILAAVYMVMLWGGDLQRLFFGL